MISLTKLTPGESEGDIVSRSEAFAFGVLATMFFVFLSIII